MRGGRDDLAADGRASDGYIRYRARGRNPNATRRVERDGAENLMLTDSIRAQLVAAAAKLNGLPASAYLGLVHGESYYGFDPRSRGRRSAGRGSSASTSRPALVRCNSLSATSRS